MMLIIVVLVVLVVVAGLLVAFIFYPAYYHALAAPTQVRCQTIGTTTTNKDDGSSAAAPERSRDHDILLSIIIPAYNEEERLAVMLQAAQSYFQNSSSSSSSSSSRTKASNKSNKHNAKNGSDSVLPLGLQLLQNAAESPTESSDNSSSPNKTHKPISIEWLVVNDGSRDGTSQVYQSFATKQQSSSQSISSSFHQHWRLLELAQNSGKGAAVRAGMLQAQGRYCLMVDADGATEFGPGLEAVAQHAAGHQFVFGSRSNHAAAGGSDDDDDDNETDDKDKTIQRSWIRRCLQAAFHAFVVLIVGNSHVQDTQCGFKLFWGRNAHHHYHHHHNHHHHHHPNNIAHALFQHLHLHRWSFDIELFVRAQEMGLQLKEIRVPWREVDGSKLNTGTLALARVAIGMLRDMICVRLCYTLGIWNVGDMEENDDNSAQGKKEQ